MENGQNQIAGATVEILCEEKLCGKTRTDSRGEFTFFDLTPRNDYTIRIQHAGFYLVQDSGYEVQAGFDSTYWPIFLEHCPKGNCDPRLRPRPLVVQ